MRIWNRTGRRPVLAAGNSNGDVPMLEFTHRPDRPTLRLLILHDDSEREFDYTTGAEQALERAHADGWIVVSRRRLDDGLLSRPFSSEMRCRSIHPDRAMTAAPAVVTIRLVQTAALNWTSERTE